MGYFSTFRKFYYSNRLNSNAGVRDDRPMVCVAFARKLEKVALNYS